MPQETTSPSKNPRGLKALPSNNVENSFSEDTFNVYYGFALRKAEEAGTISTTILQTTPSSCILTTAITI